MAQINDTKDLVKALEQTIKADMDETLIVLITESYMEKIKGEIETVVRKEVESYSLGGVEAFRNAMNFHDEINVAFHYKSDK